MKFNVRVLHNELMLHCLHFVKKKERRFLVPVNPI